jgi:hypothetical protein
MITATIPYEASRAIVAAVPATPPAPVRRGFIAKLFGR